MDAISDTWGKQIFPVLSIDMNGNHLFRLNDAVSKLNNHKKNKDPRFVSKRSSRVFRVGYPSSNDQLYAV